MWIFSGLIILSLSIIIASIIVARAITKKEFNTVVDRSGYKFVDKNETHELPVMPSIDIGSPDGFKPNMRNIINSVNVETNLKAVDKNITSSIQDEAEALKIIKEKEKQ